MNKENETVVLRANLSQLQTGLDTNTYGAG